MYQLAIIKDTIALHPTSFLLPADEAIINEINKKYADRVIQELGLAVCAFDLLEVGEGKVRYGDGCFWHKVTFRMVIFRPFLSEVIIGKIKEVNEEFIRISTGFFDDIVVPTSQLPYPHAYDPHEKAHFWVSGLGDGAEPTEIELLDTDMNDRLYIDRGETVRVRVEYDEFHDDEPGPPKAVDGVYTKPIHRRPPYEITASMASAGLGLTSWWNQTEVDTST